MPRDTQLKRANTKEIEFFSISDDNLDESHGNQGENRRRPTSYEVKVSQNRLVEGEQDLMRNNMEVANELTDDGESNYIGDGQVSLDKLKYGKRANELWSERKSDRINNTHTYI